MWNKKLIDLVLVLNILIISSCTLQTPGDVPPDPPSPATIAVENFYGKTGFLDQVKTSNTSLDCVADDATEIDDCMRTNGSWKLVLTDQTSCEGLSITEKLGLFDWDCSVLDGKVTFISAMKATTSLSSFLDPGAFKKNKLTVTDVSGAIIAETEEAVWFTDTVRVLPVSTQGTAPIILNTAGIYTFGPSSTDIITNTIGLTANKSAVVGLGGAKLKFNAGCVNSPGMPLPVCTTVFIASDFSYAEGKFFSPPADQTKSSFTVLVTSRLPDFVIPVKFGEFRNITILKNPLGDGWEADNVPNGLVLMGSFHKVSGTLNANGVRALNSKGSKNLISADITAGDNHETVVHIAGTEDTYTGEIIIGNTNHSPLHMRGSGNIINSNITIVNADFGGLTMNGATDNIFTGQITVSNINNGALQLLNGSNGNIFEGTINLDSAESCLEITNSNGKGGIGIASNENIFNDALNISNCVKGVFIRDSVANQLKGIVDIQGVSDAIYLFNGAQNNIISSVKPHSDITNYTVYVAKADGAATPKNNTIKSYNDSSFASCGVADYILQNTTSCPVGAAK